MKTGFLFLLLTLLSLEDIKERELSLWLILLLGISGIPYAWRCGHLPAWQPGILLLLIGKWTKEAVGYGDGWLILALGVWLTLDELLFLLLFGMGLGILYGGVLRKKTIPFVPFLTAAYLMEFWIR